MVKDVGIQGRIRRSKLILQKQFLLEARDAKCTDVVFLHNLAESLASNELKVEPYKEDSPWLIMDSW